MVEFRLLGPFETREGSRPLQVGPRSRRLLAALLVNAGQQVSAETLIGAVWPDRPPANPRRALQVLIHQLRRTPPHGLGAGMVTTHRAGGSLGYLLAVDADHLDVLCWHAAAADAHAAAAAGAWEHAWAQFAQALSLWRGRALGDLAGEEFARAAAARLDAEWLAAKEAQLYAGIRLGTHAELLGELRGLVAAHPLRERFWALLMLALYASGHQAEALEAYHGARAALVEQLGIEPGPPLRRLQQAVLSQHDPVHLHRLLDDLAGVPATGPVEPAPPPPAARQDVRLVTVLASRLVAVAGGDAAGDPEDARDRMTAAHRTAGRVLGRYGGTVVAQTPGRLVAAFGAHQSHDDDPDRAVRAALELAAKCVVAGTQPAGGIATGDAVVTTTADPAGASVQVEGTVVHTAVALEASARPGQLLAAQRTTEATMGIDYEPVGTPPDLRGWRVAGTRGRTGAYVTAPEGPLVGRDRELGVLAGALDRCLRDNQPHLLTLSSEPGLGKTRLVNELARHLDNVPTLVTWRSGRCLPYAQSRWGALAEILAAHLGILDGDPADLGHAKARRAVAEVATAAQAPAMTRALQAVLAATRQPQPTPALPPELVAACQRFLAALAASRPLVVVFEDLHCADAALLEFVEGLPDAAGRVPLAVVATTRPELMGRAPGWGRGGCNTVTLALKPLSAAAAEELLTVLPGGASLDTATRAAVLAAAGGNPLYLQEYLRMLRDRQGAAGICGGLGVPATVQQAITARVDTLEPADRTLLQAAAILGQVGWVGALSAITGGDRADVEEGLGRLERRDLLRRVRDSSVAGEAESTFDHPLVRDVVYQRILRAHKARGHRLAAAWFARLSAPHPTEPVAYHQQQAKALTKPSPATHPPADGGGGPTDPALARRAESRCA